LQYLKVVAFNFPEQRAVDAGHHQAGFLCAPISARQQL
jgi:hypothetical protein